MLFVAFPLLLLIFYICLNFCQFDYYVSWCVPPWVYPACNSVLPGLGLFPFPCLGSFQLSLQTFSQVLLLGPLYNVNVGAFNVIPEVS